MKLDGYTRDKLLALCDDAKRYTELALAHRVLDVLGIDWQECLGAWLGKLKTMPSESETPRHPAISQFAQEKAPFHANNRLIQGENYLSTPKMAKRLGVSCLTLREWAERDGDAAPVDKYSRWVWREHETIAWAKARIRKRKHYPSKLKSLTSLE